MNNYLSLSIGPNKPFLSPNRSQLFPWEGVSSTAQWSTCDHQPGTCGEHICLRERTRSFVTPPSHLPFWRVRDWAHERGVKKQQSGKTQQNLSKICGLHIRNRPDQEILIPGWLITSHVTLITSSYWLPTWFGRLLLEFERFQNRTVEKEKRIKICIIMLSVCFVLIISLK